MKAKITKLPNGDYSVETDVFMSDCTYLNAICALRDGQLSTNGTATRGIVISPLRIKLGPNSLPTVQALTVGESMVFESSPAKPKPVLVSYDPHSDANFGPTLI